MTDLYERDGQYEVDHLRADVRDLRTDLDSLLALTEQQRRDLADLTRLFKGLRARADFTEMVAP